MAVPNMRQCGKESGLHDQRRRRVARGGTADARKHPTLVCIPVSAVKFCYDNNSLRDQSVRLCVCKITDELLTDVKLVYGFVYVFIASVCVSLRFMNGLTDIDDFL